MRAFALFRDHLNLEVCLLLDRARRRIAVTSSSTAAKVLLLERVGLTLKMSSCVFSRSVFHLVKFHPARQRDVSGGQCIEQQRGNSLVNASHGRREGR